MVNNADKNGKLVTTKNDVRVTKIGRVIRKLRLDEIPQLINVLKGEMSFVGTRPEVNKYVKKYSDEMKATLLMPAGITSNASIQYKDEGKILEDAINSGENLDEVYINKILPDKMKYNLEYIKKFSLLRDIRVCIDTLIGVLK